MKTKEELNTLRNELETLNKKLADLTKEELAQISCGIGNDGGRIDTELRCTNCNTRMWYSEIPDKDVCPYCGSRGTLVTNI